MFVDCLSTNPWSWQIGRGVVEGTEAVLGTVTALGHGLETVP
jgi:hypothetical protein